jgi:hypothetical protein
MWNPQRKSAPRVKGGRVQKKNNWSLTGDYYITPQALPVVDRLDPGPGYRHLLYRKDIHVFVGLLPDWQELSIGLNAVVLAPGSWGDDGSYSVPRGGGVVTLTAWPRDLWEEVSTEYAVGHRDILDRLGVETKSQGDWVLLKWTESQARAYQLLHIFLHELGHHHDRMTTRRQANTSRGEPYAEAYARKYEGLIWDRYLAALGLD